MNNTKNKQLDALFKDWRRVYDRKENFVDDGIIDEIKYNKAKVQILFITKEPNDPEHIGTDFRIWWNEELYYSFSYRIAEWAYGILNDFPQYDNIWPVKNGKFNPARALDAIQKIAFMNVKKSGGGGNSKMHQINDYIERDRDFIYKQIELIDPKIIITGLSWGSTIDKLFPKIKWKPSGYLVEIGRYESSKIIDFYHPSSRNSPAASYSLLQNVVQSSQFKNI